MVMTSSYNNKFLDTCNLQTHEGWVQLCYQYENYEADFTGKVVFICGLENIQVPLLSAIVLIPSLKEFLSFSPSHTAKKDEVYAWISLDGGSEYAEAVELLLVKMFYQDEVILSSEMIWKIRDVIHMIGIKETIFQFRNSSEKFVNFNENADWLMSKDVQWQTNPTSSTVGPEVSNSASAPVTLAEEMTGSSDVNSPVDGPLVPKKSGNGNKRKNINDAIDNINARKKMKEEHDDFIMASEKTVISGPVIESSSPTIEYNTGENYEFVNPNLNISPVINDETGQNNTATKSVLDQEKDEVQIKEEQLETDSVQCPVIDCKTAHSFRVRYEFLMHLTTAHYLDKFLSSFPFGKNAKCMICVDKKAKQRTPKSKSAWITHVLTHEESWQVFPDEVVEMVKKLPKRVKGVKKSSVATEDDEKLPVQGASVEAELNPALDDGNTSYIEPHFDGAEPHFDAAEEANTATSEADSTLVMEKTEESQEESPDTTQELPDVDDADSTLVKMELQRIASLPITEEQFPQPIATSTATIDTNQLDNYFGPEDNVTPEPNSKIVIKQEAEYFEASPLFSEKELEDPIEDKDNEVPESHVCKYCTSRSFPERKKLLVHLSLVHFQRQILDKFPFKENECCPLCDQIISTKSVYLLHIGEGHEQVLSIMDEEERAHWPEEASENHKEVLTETPPEAPKVDVNQEVSPNEEARDKSSDNKSGEITCTLCSTNSRTFDKRGDFLKHLSLSHYGREILQSFPFNPDENCQFCWEESQKEYKPSKKEVHVCHVGILHQKLYAMITPEVEKLIQELSQKKTDAKTVPLMQCKYCNRSLPRKEMKEHLISHKTMLQEGNYDDNLVTMQKK